MNRFALIAAASLLATGTGAIAQSTPPAHDHQHGEPAPAPAAPPPAAGGTEGMGGMKGMESMPGMEGMGAGHRMAMMQPTAANPFPQAEMRMHMAMMHANGADADETFVRKMIEHDRGAIEMARIVATSTRDARVRQFSDQTIARQTEDIAGLQAWLARHGKVAQ